VVAEGTEAAAPAAVRQQNRGDIGVHGELVEIILGGLVLPCTLCDGVAVRLFDVDRVRGEAPPGELMGIATHGDRPPRIMMVSRA